MGGHCGRMGVVVCGPSLPCPVEWLAGRWIKSALVARSPRRSALTRP